MFFLKLFLVLASLTHIPQAQRLRTLDDPTIYEDPAACHCRVIKGKRVCTSACG